MTTEARGQHIAWSTFCESIERFDPRVTAADIQPTIARYIEVTGRPPKFMALNPKSAASLPVPDGIEVRAIGGCCQWEVWLADTDPETAPRQDVVTPSAARRSSPAAPPGATAMPDSVRAASCGVSSADPSNTTPVNYVHSKPPKHAKGVKNKKAPVTTRRGPKSRALPVERIRQLAFNGMGSKAIATRLRGEGLSVSYKTVQRRLRRKVTP